MTFRTPAILMMVLAATVFLGGQSASDRNFRECPECSEMVAIPAGKFLMGSPAHEAGRFDSEGPQHVVTVKAFALAKYPVTSAEFLTFLNATGYQPQPCNPLLGLGKTSSFSRGKRRADHGLLQGRAAMNETLHPGFERGFGVSRQEAGNEVAIDLRPETRR